MKDGRTIAIGDIHGCATALKTLLDSLKLQASDTVVMLGDAIDRGPDSRGVLEQLLKLPDRCQLVPIFGNHEQMMLDAIEGKIPLQGWLQHGGAETLDSYGKNASLSMVDEDHIRFLYEWIDYYEIDDFFFAHGNYLAKKKLKKQPWDELRWRSLKYFMPKPHISGKVAVVGHTSSKNGQIANYGHIVCIDTFCHGGGWLTAFEPVTGKIWQANQQGEVLTSELPPPVDPEA